MNVALVEEPSGLASLSVQTGRSARLTCIFLPVSTGRSARLSCIVTCKYWSQCPSVLYCYL